MLKIDHLLKIDHFSDDYNRKNKRNYIAKNDDLEENNKNYPILVERLNRLESEIVRISNELNKIMIN